MKPYKRIKPVQPSFAVSRKDGLSILTKAEADFVWVSDVLKAKLAKIRYQLSEVRKAKRQLLKSKAKRVTFKSRGKKVV